jgi:hypothetical protein
MLGMTVGEGFLIGEGFLMVEDKGKCEKNTKKEGVELILLLRAQH